MEWRSQPAGALRAQRPETPKHSAADPRYPRQVSAVQRGFPKTAWPRLVPQLEQGLSAVGGHQWPPSQEEALKHLRGIASAMPQLIQRISPFPFLNSALSWFALTLTVENSFLKVNAQWVLLPRFPQWFLYTVMDLLQCLNGRVAQREGSHVPCLPGEGKVLARSLAFWAALHTPLLFENIVTRSPWETNNPCIEQCCLKVSPNRFWWKNLVFNDFWESFQNVFFKTI